MKSEGDGSITHRIDVLRKTGDQDAAQFLWQRYFTDLVRLARDRLGTSPRTVADEEDVALSVFESFCCRAARGQFPQLDGRDALWRLLVTITARKAANQRRFERRRKRGGGRVLGEADLAWACPAEGEGGLGQVADVEPTPEFAAMVADEFRRLLDTLGDEDLRRVAIAKMEGYTNDEIGAQLGCVRRTVIRRLDVIRKIWLEAEP